MTRGTASPISHSELVYSYKSDSLFNAMNSDNLECPTDIQPAESSASYLPLDLVVTTDCSIPPGMWLRGEP
jgi:hypothetical protein